MNELRELKKELEQLEDEYREHWNEYPSREDRLENWRQKGQALREKKRKLKMRIQEIMFAEEN
jgi:predicted  nucleic acid-binding Zn-ribbon protein